MLDEGDGHQALPAGLDQVARGQKSLSSHPDPLEHPKGLRRKPPDLGEPAALAHPDLGQIEAHKGGVVLLAALLEDLAGLYQATLTGVEPAQPGVDLGLDPAQASQSRRLSPEDLAQPARKEQASCFPVLSTFGGEEQEIHLSRRKELRIAFPVKEAESLAKTHDRPLRATLVPLVHRSAGERSSSEVMISQLLVDLVNLFLPLQGVPKSAFVSGQRCLQVEDPGQEEQIAGPTGEVLVSFDKPRASFGEVI